MPPIRSHDSVTGGAGPRPARLSTSGPQGVRFIPAPRVSLHPSRGHSRANAREGGREADPAGDRGGAPVRHPALPRSAHRDPALLVRHVRRDRRERGSLRRDPAEERLLGRPGRPRLRRRLPGRHGARGRDERVDHAGRVPGSSTAAWTTRSRRRSPSTRASASSRSPTRDGSDWASSPTPPPISIYGAAAHAQHLPPFLARRPRLQLRQRRPRGHPWRFPAGAPRRVRRTSTWPRSPSRLVDHQERAHGLHGPRPPRASQPAASAAERPSRSPSRSPGAIEGNTNAFLGYVNGPGREKQVEKQVKKEAEKRVQKQGDRARSAHVVSILPPAVRVGSGCMVLVAQQAAIRLTASDASEGSPGGCSAQAVGSPARDEAKRPAPLAGAGLGQPADLQNNSAGPHRLLTAGSQVRVLQPEPGFPSRELHGPAFSQGPRV